MFIRRFQKAFDRINHVKLFEVLHNKGLHGKFLRILKDMYTDLFSCSKVNSNFINMNADVNLKDKTCYFKTTDYFPCNIGTKQGDVSSPTIFALFINELAESLRRSCGTGIFITNDINDIYCLMFADDIANCAETAAKLQQQILIIDAFCQNTGMELNLDKTEIIVFRNGGGLRNYESWSYRGSPINAVPFYKYMGVYFTSYCVLVLHT